jgi:hypothetical protein
LAARRATRCEFAVLFRSPHETVAESRVNHHRDDSIRRAQRTRGRFADNQEVAGLLAIPTLVGSAAYALAETFGWRQGLESKLRRARAFYGLLILAVAAGIALDSPT